ncbi:MAG: hypothetical protein RLZZ453_1005 [Chlamydiota bacterium]|jgi:GT2 family glycosyltransferase
MEKIAVIVLNWNGKTDTLACLKSLHSIENIDVIIVDNGSTDGSVEAIVCQFPQYTLIQAGYNLGFAEGNNVGIRIALQKGATHVLLLNNDTDVLPDLIEQLLKLMKRYPQAGIVGGKPVLFSQPDTLDHFGGRWNPKKGLFELVGAGKKEVDWVVPLELDYVCGAAVFIKREVFEAIGLLEGRFFLVWEEADFCSRAKKAGFSSMTAPQAKFLHKVSASFIGGRPHITYFWWRNRLLFISRNVGALPKMSLWIRVLLPEIFKLCKLFFLKRLQFYWYRSCKNEVKARKAEAFLLKTGAALLGVSDYFRGRLGPAPASVFRKTFD